MTTNTPAWAGCQLVSDHLGRMWENCGPLQSPASPNHGRIIYDAGEGWTFQDNLADNGPCTPILGPDGQPCISEEQLAKLAADIAAADEDMDLLPEGIRAIIARHLYVYEAGDPS